MTDNETKNDEKKVTTEITELEFSNPKMQEDRAFLRERFLKFMSGIVGKTVDFHLYENTNITGEFRGSDVDCLEIFVRNLQTPLGKVPEAILRATDVISIDIKELTV